MEILKDRPSRSRTLLSLPWLCVHVLVAALASSTYLVSAWFLDDPLRVIVPLGVLAGYGTILAGWWFRDHGRVGPAHNEAKNESAAGGLLALEEAADAFAGKLGLEDAFRLAASRIQPVTGFSTIVLFLLNESRSAFVSSQAWGKDPERQAGQMLALDEGLAGQAFTTRLPGVDGYLSMDPDQPYRTAAAIPLLHGENVYGILELLFEADADISGEIPVFEAIGTRVSALFLGALALERSRTNALTDATTDLPNERAFYLVLEKAVAEAHAARDKDPVTVLAIDIKGFEEINCVFGHIAGDTVLNHVARTLKDRVRQMDFVARALNDEFMVILPTANEDAAQDVVKRIRGGFAGQRFAVTASQEVEIDLNIGWAALGTDGETPGQLLSLAQLRKEQTKSPVGSNILWFPREMAAPMS